MLPISENAALCLVLCEYEECVEDVGNLGPGRVVGLHVNETHGVPLVDDEDGGPWKLDRALGIDLGQIKPERALGLEDVVSLLEGDANPAGQPAARIGEHGEREPSLLGGGERLVW